MSEELTIWESGFKRKAEKHNCELCGIEFLRRKSRPLEKRTRFCSSKCRGLFITKKHHYKYINLVCKQCKKEFKRLKHRIQYAKNGCYFCCRKCKDIAQSLEGNCPEIRPPHFGNGHCCYRDNYIKKHSLICNRCGYKEFESCIDIHHIDENRENNKMNNLISLCKNCHKSLHYGYWSLSELLDYKR